MILTSGCWGLSFPESPDFSDFSESAILISRIAPTASNQTTGLTPWSQCFHTLVNWQNSTGTSERREINQVSPAGEFFSGGRHFLGSSRERNSSCRAQQCPETKRQTMEVWEAERVGVWGQKTEKKKAKKKNPEVCLGVPFGLLVNTKPWTHRGKLHEVGQGRDTRLLEAEQGTSHQAGKCLTWHPSMKQVENLEVPDDLMTTIKYLDLIDNHRTVHQQ